MMRCSRLVRATAPVKDLERKLRTRDVTIRASTKNGMSQIIFASTSGLLCETVKRHRLGTRTHGHRPFLELLGTQLTFTNILASLQEGEERVVSHFTSEEATIVTEALALGECRCCVRPNHNAVSDGPPFALKVDRVLYRQSDKFSSLTAACLDELRAVPECDSEVAGETISLGLDTFPLNTVEEYFTHNISLHGYNFFRRSEGSSVALICHAHLGDESVQEALNRCAASAESENGGTEAEALDETNDQLDAALRSKARSFGALMRPLVAGRAAEADAKRMQRALVCASIDGVLHKIVERAQCEDLACQDFLALVSGDHDGAYKIAEAARQFTQDPSVSAPLIDNLRELLGIKDIQLTLEPSTLIRHGLDYFCRCSKSDFLLATRSLSSEVFSSLMREGSFRCTFCSKVHMITEEEWKSVSDAQRM